MFRHPKYYKELRKLRNKSDQAISDSVDPASGVDSVRSGPGLMLPDSKMVKQRATSSTSRDQERQASSPKQQATSRKPQAPSDKHQAPSDKHQA
jgi:hypothetical protein